MVHTENSGEGRVSSNSQWNYTIPTYLAAGNIIESNKAMFSALTEVLQKTCINTPNVQWSKSISWQRQLLKWLLHIMPISWLEGALRTHKIPIMQILGKMMKKMIDGIGSLSMKQIGAFTMKPTWQLPFCLFRKPYQLQWQQQVCQKMNPWWVQSSENFLNLTFKPMKTGANRHMRK